MLCWLWLALTLTLGMFSCKKQNTAYLKSDTPPAKSPGESQKFDLSSFSNLLAKHSNFDDFLWDLPFSIRENYVLMHHSLSSQEATPLTPRVIMFDRKGSFFLAFNGAYHESEKKNGVPGGHDVMELQYFNEAESTFDFYEIKEKDMKLSEKNPEKCIQCHQDPLRPNWEPYFSWPGSYGEDSDGILIGLEEETNLKTLRPTLSKRDRYRSLVEPEEALRVSGLKEESRTISGKMLSRLKYGSNRALTIVLFRRNLMRISRIFKQQATPYLQHKYLLAYTLSGCLGSQVDSEKMSILLPESRGTISPLLNSLNEIKVELVVENTSEGPRIPYGLGLHMFSYLNSNLKLGFSIESDNLSLSFIESDKLGKEFNTTHFNDGSSKGDSISKIVPEAFAQLDNDFKKYSHLICENSDAAAALKEGIVYSAEFCNAKQMSEKKVKLEKIFTFFSEDPLELLCKSLEIDAKEFHSTE